MRTQIDNSCYIVYSAVIAFLKDELQKIKNRMEECDFGPAQFAYESGRATELENLIKVFEKWRKEL